jgi:gluconokinase
MTMTEPPRELGKTVIVVMGVAGSGKSTIAQLLAQQLGWMNIEGDDLHPPENVAKMAAGTPLSDADREPWLRRISQRIDHTEGHQVITCSALRRSYRDILRTADARVRFLHLTGSRDVLGSRLGARTEHFMPSSLLASQLETLEPLTPDEDGVSIDIHGTPTDIVARALQALQLDKSAAAQDSTDENPHRDTEPR